MPDSFPIAAVGRARHAPTHVVSPSSTGSCSATGTGSVTSRRRPAKPDPRGASWLVLLDPAGRSRLCFQGVDRLPPSTWPDDGVPQQLHLDLSVPSADDLVVQRDRALSLGARQLFDRFDHPEEPLYVFADPAGHPFCIYVSHPGAPEQSV